MEADSPITALLSTLTESVTSALSSLPETTSLASPTDGISLLDTKNELLLSYLQNLVFLIILKLRNCSSNHNTEDDTASASLSSEVIKKLIELRVYLEKGVRPLESRLKYQLDKLLLAASEAAPTPTTNGATKTSITTDNNIKATTSDSESEIDTAPPSQIPDLAHRPNPSAFTRPSQSSRSTAQDPTGPYRPPRVAPTALPTTERKAAKPSKPRNSRTLDAFIREEMNDTPIAEPSIGAGSGLKGKAREEEGERRGYEEQRLVRLPGEKKGKKRRGRPDEDLSGGLSGLGDVEFGDLKGAKRRRREKGGEGARIGERWEKRVGRDKARKRR